MSILLISHWAMQICRLFHLIFFCVGSILYLYIIHNGMGWLRSVPYSPHHFIQCIRLALCVLNNFYLHSNKRINTTALASVVIRPNVLWQASRQRFVSTHIRTVQSPGSPNVNVHSRQVLICELCLWLTCLSHLFCAFVFMTYVFALKIDFFFC